MPCDGPISIRNPDGKSEADRLTVPCGNCAGCLQSRRAEWTFRCTEELRNATSAQFVTLKINNDNLTYSEETGESEVQKKELQDFFKRLRSNYARVTLTPRQRIPLRDGKRPPLSYYAIGEYGEKLGRPHYHILLFNLPNDLTHLIEKSWQKGFIDIGKVEPGSIHYVTGYIINSQESEQGRQSPFALISKNLGNQYLDRNAWYHKKNNSRIVYIQGKPQKIPRYYAKKIFSYKQNDEHLAKIIKDQDTRINREHARLRRQGKNPFIEEDHMVYAKKRKINKSLKSKLL